MDGLMMDYPLTLLPIFERAGQLFPEGEIVSRRPDRSLQRSTYRELHGRVRRLCNALVRLGVKPGERVATLAWNHGRHLEAYFAVPLVGGVLHTLNPRLSVQDLAYIMGHAEDQVLLVDDVLLPLWDRLKKDVHPRQVVVWGHGAPAPDGTVDYEALIASEPESFAFPRLEENQAAGLCYTSGTTGRPKGVLYSHRAMVLHSITTALPDCLCLGQADVVMPVVPMFHVNAWGLPFSCTLTGARQVFPGPHLDPVSLLELIERERVTLTAGVPTVWGAVLEALDREPKRWDTSSVKTIMVGGSAVPASMIEGFDRRHGLQMVHGWGMTEMSPVGTLSRLKASLRGAPEAERLRLRATQGLPLPFVETRVVSATGPVPADGKTMGELHVRGPWIARSYFKNPVEADKFTADGWFRTGDVVSVEPHGYVRITDRSKDLIKSGGEWISSVDLENAIMGHPAVREAAVVAVPHPKWDERPVACVVLKDGESLSEAGLRAYLEPLFARWWLPDKVVFLEQIPRTSVGKFLKSALREKLKDLELG